MIFYFCFIMQEKEITYTNPHDRYFKAVFSDKHNVEGLLQGALPEIYKNIDLQTLQIDNNSYIKKELNPTCILYYK